MTVNTKVNLMLRIIGVVIMLAPMVLATAAERTVKDLFAEVYQSVVTINTWEQMVTVQDGIGLIPIAHQGSGILISQQGEVLTAAHLVQTAELVRVTFVDGTSVGAMIVATEPAADVALLKLDDVPDSTVVAKMSDSDSAQIGEQVFIIGAPFGLSHTLTVGYISARHAPGTLAGELVLGEFLQTDAAINRGNSGGPMFNMAGEVLGIVSYIFSKSGGFDGVGFAVTSNTARTMLLERNSLWTGVTVFGLNGMMAKVFNLPQDTGFLVQRVARGSLGARFGLQPSIIPAKIGKFELLVGGDIILAVDHIQVGLAESEARLRQHLATLEPGQSVNVTVLRQGEIITLSAPVWE